VRDEPPALLWLAKFASPQAMRFDVAMAETCTLGSPGAAA
jgi:hypothetical protein